MIFFHNYSLDHIGEIQVWNVGGCFKTAYASKWYKKSYRFKRDDENDVELEEKTSYYRDDTCSEELGSKYDIVTESNKVCDNKDFVPYGFTQKVSLSDSKHYTPPKGKWLKWTVFTDATCSSTPLVEVYSNAEGRCIPNGTYFMMLSFYVAH